MSNVCAECFDDTALSNVVTSCASDDECSFCGATGDAIAAPLDDVVDHVRACLAHRYDEADNVLFYDNESPNGYAGETWTTDELLRDEAGLALAGDGAEELFDALVKALGDDRCWSVADPAILEEHERLRFDWEQFCYRIKHASRFFLLSSPDERAALAAIGDLSSQHGLVRTLAAGSRFIRARQQTKEMLTTPADLGPPPDEFAVQSNRMSPPGISLLYAAGEEATAIAETAREDGTYACGEFEVLEPTPVIDLTRVPPVPSFFDLPARPTRDGIMFLNRLSREMSRPIARDDRIHLEYIPTQVVTEYLRREFVPAVKGILYPSAQQDDGTCVALFAGAGAVVGGHGADAVFPERRWIRLVRAWSRRVQLKPVAL